MVGSISSVGNCLARIGWGLLSDLFPFKIVILSNVILTMILTITIRFIAGIEAAYMIWVFLIFFCFGGLFTIFPKQTNKMFGSKFGSSIYGVLY